MRWYILRALLHKETMRHLADRGGIFLAALLLAAVMLLRFVGTRSADGTPAISLASTPRQYFVDYWEKGSPWIEHLRQNRPTKLRVHLRYKEETPLDPNGNLYYPQSTAAVQVRTEGTDSQGRPRYAILFLQPGEDPAELAPFADWFWKETCHYFQTTPLAIESAGTTLIPQPEQAIIQAEVRPDGSGVPRARRVYWPADSATVTPAPPTGTAARPAAPIEMEVSQNEMTANADQRSIIAAGLIFFPVCFFCVYLMPTLTCEERERGILLAQALSPASPAEILAAKFLFYPTIGIGLATLLAGVFRPATLAQPLFWVSMLALAVGYLGVGVTISSLARTQRRASMGALFYMLAVALLLLICTQNGIMPIPYLTLEFLVPRVLHAVLSGNVSVYHWFHALGALVLAIGWAALATRLFRRHGWQ